VDAADVLQDTYMEAFKHLSKYLQTLGTTLYAGLCQIVRQEVGLHHGHSRPEERAIPREAPPPPAGNPASGGIAGHEPGASRPPGKYELAECLRLALGQLGEEERELILWRHFKQLSARDVAKLLQVSEAAAGRRYIRAVERLRSILADLGVSSPGCHR